MLVRLRDFWHFGPDCYRELWTFRLGGSCIEFSTKCGDIWRFIFNPFYINDISTNIYPAKPTPYSRLCTIPGIKVIGTHCQKTPRTSSSSLPRIPQRGLNPHRYWDGNNGQTCSSRDEGLCCLKEFSEHFQCVRDYRSTHLSLAVYPNPPYFRKTRYHRSVLLPPFSLHGLSRSPESFCRTCASSVVSFEW